MLSNSLVKLFKLGFQLLKALLLFDQKTHGMLIVALANKFDSCHQVWNVFRHLLQLFKMLLRLQNAVSVRAKLVDSDVVDAN